MASKPCTVQEIFNDYSGRRTAIVNALTHEFGHFYTLYDPVCGEFLSKNVKLRLYGHPNESWEVTLPPEKVAGVVPEPANVGISLSSYNLNSRDWLPQVAARSDSWLVSIAFFHGACLNKHERMKKSIMHRMRRGRPQTEGNGNLSSPSRNEQCINV